MESVGSKQAEKTLLIIPSVYADILKRINLQSITMINYYELLSVAIITMTYYQLL